MTGSQWIGIDITHLAIALVKYRMQSMFPGIKLDVIGEPTDLEGAKALAKESEHDGRYQFQWWALSLVRAKPVGGQAGEKKGKKGADRGMDGLINFFEDDTGKPKQVIVQVKSGKHVGPADIRDLAHVVDREKAAIGVMIMLYDPTPDTVKATLEAGKYYAQGWNKDYPKVQILTIAELLKGAEVKMPPEWGTFKQVQAEKEPAPEQQVLGL